MMIGAPVFALTGYAVASHVIPRGFAFPQFGLAWGAELPLGKATRPVAVLVRASPGLSGIFKGQSLLNGRATPPTTTRLFLLSFFSPGKKALLVGGIYVGDGLVVDNASIVEVIGFFFVEVAEELEEVFCTADTEPEGGYDTDDTDDEETLNEEVVAPHFLIPG